MRSRLFSLGVCVLVPALLSFVSGCKQPSTSSATPSDSLATTQSQTTGSVPDSVVSDSLEVLLTLFENAAAPTATDSTRLRRWADSVVTGARARLRQAPSQARRHYQQALRAYQQLGDSLYVTELNRAIGITYGLESENEKALARFREALNVSQKLGHRRGISAALNNIGIIHQRQGQYDKALVRYRESLEIDRDMEKNRSDLANSLTNIGIIYRRKGRYEEALSHYREALELRRAAGDREGVAQSLNNIGIVHRKQDQHKKALDTYREALELSREMDDRLTVAKTLHNIGVYYKDLGQYEKALSYSRRAVALNREMGERLIVAEGLQKIGDLHLRAGRVQAATDTLARAVRLAETIRRDATSPDARRSLLSTQIDAYQALTTAHVRLGRPDSALRSVEQARARLLADRLAGTATGDTSFAPPTAAELRRTLDPNEAALLYTNTETGRSLTALVVTRDTTVARELPASRVRAAVQDDYSTRLTRLRRTEGPLTAAFTGDASEEDLQDAAPSLAEVIRLYRYYLTREQADPSIRDDLSRRLHGLLVEPVDDAIGGTTELIAVPTGALGYLPLETLQDSTGIYLAEQTRVRYAQSLTVLRQLQERSYPERERPLLAVGGAAYASGQTKGRNTPLAETRRGTSRVATAEHASALLRGASRRMEQGKSPRPAYRQLGYDQWPQLYGTKLEVQKLKRATGREARLLTGSSASEERVRQLSTSGQLARYRRVHFATHGVAVPEAPALSALVLSQNGASDSLASRDGYLTMQEIAGLTFAADVAVLSACETGLGRIVAGEGVVSLSHAFLRAGANATLVSQWRVPDWSTQQFMAAVYRKADEEGTSFAEATTEVKRSFIDGAYGKKNTDPLRWAPFVYYGRE